MLTRREHGIEWQRGGTRNPNVPSHPLSHNFPTTDQMFGAPRGAFTTTQFKTVCRRKLGVNLSDADAEHLFDRVDADGSGNVDFTEFISGFLPQGERRGDDTAAAVGRK